MSLRVLVPALLIPTIFGCAAATAGGGDGDGDMTGDGDMSMGDGDMTLGATGGGAAVPGMDGMVPATDPGAGAPVGASGGTSSVITPVTGSGGTTTTDPMTPTTPTTGAGCDTVAGTMLHNFEAPYTGQSHVVDPGSTYSAGFVWGGNAGVSPPTFDFVSGEGCDGGAAAGGVAPNGGWLILGNYAEGAPASLATMGSTGISFSVRNPGTTVTFQTKPVGGAENNTSIPPSDDYVTYQITWAELGVVDSEIEHFQWLSYSASSTIYVDNVSFY